MNQVAEEKDIVAAATAEFFKYTRACIGPYLKYPTFTFVSDPLFNTSPPRHPHLLIPGSFYYDLKSSRWRYFDTLRGWIDVDPSKTQYHPNFPQLRLQRGSDGRNIPEWSHPAGPRGFNLKVEERRAQLGHESNAWFLPYLEWWMLQSTSSQSPIADRVIDKILTHPHPLTRFPPISNVGIFNNRHQPTYEMAINSLWAAASSPNLDHQKHDIFDIQKGGGACPNVSMEDFIRVFANPGPSSRCLSILDLPVSDIPSPYSNNMSSPLMMMRAPTGLRDNLYIVPNREDDPRKLEQHVTYVMRGGVTPPHQDFYLHPQLLYHIFGIKIWLLWPQNDHNKRYFLRAHMLADDQVLSSDVTEAIDKLTDMEILVIDEPKTAFIVPSGMYHACISITHCVHTGCRTVDLRQVARTSTMVKTWVTEFLASVTAVENGDDTFFLGELQDSEAPNSMMVHLLHWIGCVRRLGKAGIKYRSHLEEAASELWSLWASPEIRLTFRPEDKDEDMEFELAKELLDSVGKGDWSLWY